MGGVAGQLLVALFGPAAAILIAGAARAAGFTAPAWLAASSIFRRPGSTGSAVIAYVEGPLCFYHAALVWGVVEGRGRIGVLTNRTWGLIGLLAGCAMGCKYTGFVSAVIPFGTLSLLGAWRRKSVLPVGCFLVGWAVVMSPWLGKNVLDTGNPVYPLASRIFPSPEWDSGRELRWQNAHGPRPIDVGELKSSTFDLLHGKKLHADSFLAVRQFWSSLLDVAGRSDWQSPLYVALAPLALRALPGAERCSHCGCS